MFKHIAAVVLALVLCGPVSSRAAWDGPGGPAAPSVAVRELAPGQLRVTVTVPGIDLAGVVEQGRPLVRVGLPGAYPSLDAGAPDLPVFPVQVALGEGGAPVVSIVSERWREVPIDAPVRPSRGNLPRTEDPAAHALEFGPAYAGGLHPADAVGAGRPYRLHGVRGLGLRLAPVRWDVDRGVLLVLEAIELAVSVPGATGEAPEVTDAFRPVLAGRFANPPAADKYRPVTTGGRMLVVVPAAFVNAVGDFVQWKRERGIAPLMLVVEQAGGTADAIRDTVRARYEEPAGLTYVVLMGDEPLVPGFRGAYEQADDDTRYAQMDEDDLYPDLFVSRVSARDLTELQTQLVKLVAYERDPEPDGAWYAHATGAASNQGTPTDAQRADGLRDVLLGWTFTDVDRIYEPAATGAMLSAAINDGRSLLNYLGHGSGTSWSNPEFNIADVHALANGARLPWVIDVSCANGRFSDPECFAEAWLRTGSASVPAGAIAMYSASTTTPWVPPTVMQEEAMALLASGAADEIGALCQGGIMKVLDVYPGDEGRQLVEQYNIFGDCSLQVRTAPPVPLTVRHQGFLAPGVDVLPVDAGVAGARVAVTSAGVLHGTAVTDASGYAAVPLEVPAAGESSVVLTVTGRNLLPHRESIPVVVAATVAVQTTPATLQVGQPGSVAVTLGGLQEGIEAVDLTLGGWGVDPVHARLAGAGTATFSGLRPRYGEDLRLEGRDAGTGRVLFQRLIPVSGAADLTSPRIQAGVGGYGMVDLLAPLAGGNVTGSAAEAGLALAVRGCGIHDSGTTPYRALTLQVRPDSLGQVTAALLKDGYRAVVTQIPVVPAVGTVAGRVTDVATGLAVSGARVVVTDRRGGILVDTTTDGQGWWKHEPDLPAGPTTVTVSRWGYDALDFERTLLYGANDWRTELAVAPRYPALGTIMDAVSGEPLRARVELRRADDRVLVAAAVADADGHFVSTALPVGDYLADCTLNGYLPRLVPLTVGETTPVPTIPLAPVSGSIIVVDLNLTPGVVHAFGDRTDKTGAVTAVQYATLPAGSGLAMVSTLITLGYTVSYQPSGMIQPAAWPDYDLVLMSCGDRPDAVPASVRDPLLARVQAGGRVLCEGGDLAAAMRGDTDFLAGVLGVADWAGDRGDSLNVRTTGHALAERPAPIFGVIDLVGRGYADGDALRPTATATVAATWNDGSAAATALDGDGDREHGLAVHLAVSWNRLDVLERTRLLQNAVEWLLHAPAADAGLVGRVVDAEGAPVAGAAVWLEPGGRATVTTAGGSFAFGDLVPGRYAVGASADSLAGVRLEVETAAQAMVTLPDLVLPAAADTVLCGAGGPIPDGAAAGLPSVVAVSGLGVVGGVRVHVDWQHAWAGDVQLTLTSPAGTTVPLKLADGRHEDATSAWYAGDLAPAGDLRMLVGEPSEGAWTLRAADLAAGDAGSLEGWCLQLVTVKVIAEPPPPPAGLAVLDARPNPFNPSTTIRCAVPRAGRVVVAVFDLRGRRVRTLLDGPLEAAVHEIAWDGRDGDGRAAASGAYVVRMVAPGGAASAKLMLVR